METPELNQGLVDFKEKMVFETYKDNDLKGARWFKELLKNQYGFDYEQSSRIYVSIIKYQVNTYGETIRKSNGILIKTGRNATQREKVRERALRSYRAKVFIERIERNESKRIK